MIKILFLFIITTFSFSNDILILENANHYEIMSKVNIYTNREKNIDIQSIMNDSTNWENCNTKFLNLGYSNKTHWLKLDVTNKSYKDYFLEFNLTLIDLIDVYNVESNKLQSVYKTGIDRPFFSRPFISNKFTIPLNLIKDKKQTIYIKIKNSFKPNTFSFNISSFSWIQHHTFSSYILDAMIIAILVVMFFYNFIIYFFTKYKPYRFYLLYTFTIISLSIGTLQYGYMYIYPNSILFNKVLIALFESLIPFSMILFIKDILYIKEQTTLSRVLNIFLLITIFSFILQFYTITFNNSYTYLSSKYSTISAGIVIFFITLVLIKEIMGKNTLAKLIFISWVFPLSTLLVYIINRFYFFINLNTITIFVQFSFIIELVLMSLIIVYKISSIENEKKELLIKNQKKDLELLTQAKFAAMGELLQYITHQWKQPLMRINSILLNMETNFEEIPKEEIELSKYLDLIEFEIDDMSQIISTFAQYFHPYKEKSSINLYSLVKETIDFYKKNLPATDINFHINCSNKKIETTGFKEEYRQVLLIIFNNAYDAFERADLKGRNITCTIETILDKVFLSIENNGSVIQEEDFEKVFAPYYSTTKNDKNRGIGLYIAKVIIEDSMNKKIDLTNTVTGVKFTIIG